MSEFVYVESASAFNAVVADDRRRGRCGAVYVVASPPLRLSAEDHRANKAAARACVAACRAARAGTGPTCPNCRGEGCAFVGAGAADHSPAERNEARIAHVRAVALEDDTAWRERALNLGDLAKVGERDFMAGTLGDRRLNGRSRQEVLAAAWHEAGHACAVLFCGGRVKAVSLVASGTSLGRVVHDGWGAALRTDRDRCTAEAIVAFAGAVAVREKTGRYHHGLTSCSGDLSRVRELAREAHPGDAAAQARFEREALAEAHELLDAREWRLATQYLAVRLLMQGELTGPAAEAAILECLPRDVAAFIRETAAQRDARIAAADAAFASRTR